MNIFTTFAIKEVLLEVVTESEEYATLWRRLVDADRLGRIATYSLVGRSVDPVRTRDSLIVSGRNKSRESDDHSTELEDHG